MRPGQATQFPGSRAAAGSCRWLPGRGVHPPRSRPLPTGYCEAVPFAAPNPQDGPIAEQIPVQPGEVIAGFGFPTSFHRLAFFPAARCLWTTGSRCGTKQPNGLGGGVGATTRDPQESSQKRWNSGSLVDTQSRCGWIVSAVWYRFRCGRDILSVDAVHPPAKPHADSPPGLGSEVSPCPNRSF